MVQFLAFILPFFEITLIVTDKIEVHGFQHDRTKIELIALHALSVVDAEEKSPFPYYYDESTKICSK